MKQQIRQLYILFLLTIIVGCDGAEINSDTEVTAGLKVKEVASGFDVPWGLAFISPKEILITERRGTLRKLDLDSANLIDISGGAEVLAAGQGGLMDIAVSPNYSQDGWLYMTFSKAIDGESATALARARLEDDRLVDYQELFVSNHLSNRHKHFGSRIAFDGKGHIFFSHGDRGNRPSAQDLGDHAGSILRLNLDGSIPQDNPFINVENAMPEIWSYGHRNPQGLAYDESNDRLWAIEHGPRGGDEINLVEAGKNYGWPVISYGREYRRPAMVGEGTHKPGMEQPAKYYVPSIAPCSLLLYSGSYYPQFKGNLLAGALRGQHLNVVEVDGRGVLSTEQRYLGNLNQRIRSLVQGPDGKLYFGTDSGRVYSLLKN